MSLSLVEVIAVCLNKISEFVGMETDALLTSGPQESTQVLLAPAVQIPDGGWIIPVHWLAIMSLNILFPIDVPQLDDGLTGLGFAFDCRLAVNVWVSAPQSRAGVIRPLFLLWKLCESPFEVMIGGKQLTSSSLERSVMLSSSSSASSGEGPRELGGS